MTRHPIGLPPQLTGIDRTLVMGIVNVTPDSFSDGGRWAEPQQAIAHALDLVRDGADIVDIGGESTRPGAEPVGVDEECRRVLPVVTALAEQNVCVSIDTMWAQTAQAALEAGATVVNDVSGGLADADMAGVVAAARTRAGTPPVYIAMHWRGPSTVMSARTDYGDVARDSAAELAAQLGALAAAGLDPATIVADPGPGFAKTGAQNWELLHGLHHYEALGRPLLLAVSRKRFLETLREDLPDRALLDKDAATAALSALAAARELWAVRVHDVAGSAAAVRVAGRLGRWAGTGAAAQARGEDAR